MLLNSLLQTDDQEDFEEEGEHEASQLENVESRLDDVLRRQTTVRRALHGVVDGSEGHRADHDSESEKLETEKKEEEEEEAQGEDVLNEESLEDDMDVDAMLRRLLEISVRERMARRFAEQDTIGSEDMVARSENIEATLNEVAKAAEGPDGSSHLSSIPNAKDSSQEELSLQEMLDAYHSTSGQYQWRRGQGDLLEANDDNDELWEDWDGSITVENDRVGDLNISGGDDEHDGLIVEGKAITLQPSPSSVVQTQVESQDYEDADPLLSEQGIEFTAIEVEEGIKVLFYHCRNL
jgi:hypothetical protein